MTPKFLVLFLVFFIGWIFPPVFSPIGLSLMGVLIAQGEPSWLLLIVIALATISSYIPIWWIVGKMFPRHGKTQREVGNPKSFLGKLYQSLADIVQNALKSDQYKKLTKYLDTKTGKWIVFGVQVLLCSPIASNVIAVLILRNKISLKRLLLVATIGESLGAITFVYGGVLVKCFTNAFIIGRNELLYEARFFYFMQ